VVGGRVDPLGIDCSRSLTAGVVGRGE